MRRPKPIELEVSIPDRDLLQNVIDLLLVDVVRYTLERSDATYEEKVSYVDAVVRALRESKAPRT